MAGNEAVEVKVAVAVTVTGVAVLLEDVELVEVSIAVSSVS